MYSFPDGFECKITQTLDLGCNTGCGCNTSMEVSPPGSCPVGQGDGDHGKQSQPSWHCEGDKPRSAAQPPATCYLKFWCRKLDCNVKYRCTGRDNTTSVCDCLWDQDDSPGECKFQNNVPVVSGTTPPVCDHNDSSTDDVNNEEQGSCIIPVVITVITTLSVILFSVYLMGVCKYRRFVYCREKVGIFFNCPQSAPVNVPAAESCPDVKDDGSIAGQFSSNGGGADERLLPVERAASTVVSMESRPGHERSTGVEPAERSSSVQIDMEDNESIAELEDGANAAVEAVSKRSRAG